MMTGYKTTYPTMIYYSNSDLTQPHMTFIGRWSPFHQGHTAIIQKKMIQHKHLPVLIMVRNTTTDQYAPTHRAEYIKIWMLENNVIGTIMIVPNIEGIYWGRGVGYTVEQVDVDQSIQQVSATAIRKGMKSASNTWKSLVATKDGIDMLAPIVSNIIDHGMVLWLTGCPSSGKTTLSKEIITQLHTRYPHLKIQLLDGDDMRASPLATNAGFSKTDRAQHILRMAYLAKMFADHGILVICAFVSPDRSVRKKAKQIIGDARFIEIYIRASKKTRMRRDVKGMYAKAATGQIKNFTGFNAPYEVPISPSVICDTDKETVAYSAKKIIKHLLSKKS